VVLYHRKSSKGKGGKKGKERMGVVTGVSLRGVKDAQAGAQFATLTVGDEKLQEPYPRLLWGKCMPELHWPSDNTECLWKYKPLLYVPPCHA